MGLAISHDGFHIAYSAFNRLRQAVAQAVDGSFPPHRDPYLDGVLLDDNRWYVGDDYPEEKYPGLWEFLGHSDCDGEIAPDMCTKVADDLEPLIPVLETYGEGGGHIARDGGYAAVLKTFCEACRTAAAANEPLEFK